MIDPRAPVVVGVGQTSQRVSADVARAPIDLLADAARAADEDTGTSTSLLERADIVAIVAIGSWRYPDAGAFLARRLGITPRATAVSTVGGNSPQVLVSEFATRIQRGECDVVLIGGGESMHTRWRARREPRVELTWDTGDDAPCPWVIGDDRPGASDYEMAHLAVAPTMVYPLFETALRNELGHGVEQHQKHVSELWSRVREGIGAQSARVVADGLLARGDPNRLRRQPDGVFSVSETHVRQHRRRSGRGAVALLVRGGAGGRRSRRAHGLPAQRERGARPLLHDRTVVARRFARDQGFRARGARRGAHRHRRRRAPRLVFVLSIRGPDRSARDRRRPATVVP